MLAGGIFSGKNSLVTKRDPLNTRGQTQQSLWGAEAGTHLCALYHGEAELEQIAATFVSNGLAAGDRVLYVASDRPAATVRTALEAHQVAAGLAAAAGQLVIEDFAAAYGEPGHLDLATMAAGFRAAGRQARADGFGGLRVAAEMGNVARSIGSVERLLDWERSCTPLQREEGITSVCQYDQRRFSHQQAAMITREHAGIAPELAPEPPARFTATTAPWGLIVAGELDLSSRVVFGRVLNARLAVSPWLQLDVGGLAYAEAGALAVIYQAAATLVAVGGIIVTHAPAHLLRVIDLAGFDHPRVVID
jgi:DcmR-like sensory protein/STAS domain-containing protein